VTNKARVIVKAVGDFDFTRAANPSYPDKEQQDTAPEETPIKEKQPLQGGSGEKGRVDISSYKPKVVNREWIISELDLEFICSGCYILGTGGGGTPYPEFLRLREMMRKGAVIRVIDLRDLADDVVVAGGGEFLTMPLGLFVQ
jgi:hypothetical protein